MEKRRIALAMVMVGVVSLAVPAPAMAAPAPAVAAPVVADLGLEAFPGEVNESGETLTIKVITHNYGPGTTPTGSVVSDTTAPGGTVFTHAQERELPNPRCTVLVPHRRVRCNSYGQNYPDYDQPSGVDGGLVVFVMFKVVGTCISPGRLTYEYPGDPKRSNNSVAYRVSPRSFPVCQGPKATPTTTKPPAARPSATATAASTPTPTATITESAAPVPTPQGLDPTPTINAEPKASMTPILTAAGTLTAVAVAGVLAVWLIRRRRMTATPPS